MTDEKCVILRSMPYKIKKKKELERNFYPVLPHIRKGAVSSKVQRNRVSALRKIINSIEVKTNT